MPGSNNLCCGIMKGILIYLVPFHCRDCCGSRVLSAVWSVMGGLHLSIMAKSH
jgi:hypothetical protein